MAVALVALAWNARRGDGGTPQADPTTITVDESVLRTQNLAIFL